MTVLRRYLSLCALLFWQGGFTFYAAVVIPIAGAILQGTHLRARITDQVVSWLNWAGVVALALLLWDLMQSADASRRRRMVRGVCWAVMFVTLAALFPLHYWMDLLDPPQGMNPADVGTFNVAHSVYLWVSTAQWAAALTYLFLAVRAWRDEDSQSVVAEGVRMEKRESGEGKR